MIIDSWMPEHRHFITGPWQFPPGPQRCQHAKWEWFINYFDKDSPESLGYFVSRRDVQADHWNNTLQKQCTSARDTFDIPHHNTYGTTLYMKMMDRPDLFLQWHNAPSGGFYLCIGCANCSSVTGHYQPQNHVDELGLNPEPKKVNKAMKELPAVRSAFRAFLAAVLDAPDLAPGERCRHLHKDTAPVLPLDNGPNFQ